MESRKSEERPESRGRLRKIFASSPSRSLQDEKVTMEEIYRVTNLRGYLHKNAEVLGW